MTNTNKSTTGPVLVTAFTLLPLLFALGCDSATVNLVECPDGQTLVDGECTNVLGDSGTTGATTGATGAIPNSAFDRITTQVTLIDASTKAAVNDAALRVYRRTGATPIDYSATAGEATVSVSSPEYLKILATAPGYLPNISYTYPEHLQTSTMPLVSNDFVSENLAISHRIDLSADETGSVQNGFTLSVTTASGTSASLIVPESAKLLDAEGNIVTGKLSMTVAHANAADSNTLALLPFAGSIPNSELFGMAEDADPRPNALTPYTGTLVLIENAAGNRVETFTDTATLTVTVPDTVINQRTAAKLLPGEAVSGSNLSLSSLLLTHPAYENFVTDDDSADGVLEISAGISQTGWIFKHTRTESQEQSLQD